MLIQTISKARVASRPNTLVIRSAPSEPRVLIADDQADVLEALRLLLKAEGFQLETASSPAGVLAAVEAREFDVALIDLNYTRDTTSGEEGLNLLSRIQALDPDAARRRDDRVGQRRGRGRSHAPRRPRLHPEAVGQRAAARDHPHADRAEPGAAQGPAARSRELAAARRGACRSIVAESPAMQTVLQVISRVGPVGRQRPDHRRERHRQGRRRAGAARRVEPRLAADGDRQFRRRLGRRLRERAVRPRARRVHRRQGGSRRPVRARRPGHAVSRRDRQRARSASRPSCCG